MELYRTLKANSDLTRRRFLSASEDYASHLLYSSMNQPFPQFCDFLEQYLFSVSVIHIHPNLQVNSNPTKFFF